MSKRHAGNLRWRALMSERIVNIVDEANAQYAIKAPGKAAEMSQ